MNVFVDPPRQVSVPGLADEMHLTVDGEFAEGAVRTSALRTRRRLPGMMFNFESAEWRVVSAEETGPITKIVFRRQANG